ESIEAGRLRRPDQNQKRGAGNMFLHHSSYSTDPPESRLFCMLCKPLSNAAGNEPRKRVIRLSISYPGIGLPIPKSRFRIPSVSAKTVKNGSVANLRDLFPTYVDIFKRHLWTDRNRLLMEAIRRRCHPGPDPGGGDPFPVPLPIH